MHVKSTILISNCKLWISLFFEKRYMTVFFMMMMMMATIRKTLLRMLHLHPAHWHSLKTQLQQPLVPEAFPIWFLAVGIFPLLSSLSHFLSSFSAHCIRKVSLSDVRGLASLTLQRANIIHAMCTFLL